MAKINTNLQSSKRKSRKAHYDAPSGVRRVVMSAPLTKKMRVMHNVHSLERTMKSSNTNSCDVVARDKSSGSRVPLGIDASSVVITKLKIDKDREDILAHIAKGREATKAKKSTSA